MLSVDPVRLARRQLAKDTERTARFAHLLDHKIERMVPSPLAFLRGSAPLFYELLERHPDLGKGAKGEGWLVGDAHIENFGAYRAGRLSVGESDKTRKDERIVFDLNDFDDAFIGPWRLDVLRLTTSLVLGGREIGADGPHTIALCDALIDAYVGAVFQSKRPPPEPPAVVSLVGRVRARTRKELLDARTSIDGGRRHFARGARYTELSDKLRDKSVRAFARYVRRLPARERPPEDALQVLDASFRVAGTGSLGCLRVAVLVTGKGGEDGAWVFDLKEQGEPSAACLVRPPRMDPAERVRTAIATCLANPPRMIGATRLGGASMFVRRLSPQEDKINLASLHPKDLEPLARHLGALLGAAHRRGATRMPKKAWSPDVRSEVLSSSVALAGVHEAVYLAYCDLVRKRGRVNAAKPAPSKS